MAAFTAVAAGIGMATTAVTTGMSFVQAGKQKKLQRQAEAEADKAMQEARKKLEVNFYEQLGIAKEPFELQREAMNQQAAAALEAVREGEARGAAAGAGRIQMAQQQGQAEIRSAMSEQLTELEKLQAAEESRLRDVGVGLDLEEVAGAQLAAANAQEMRAQAVQQGMQGITSLGQQVASLAPLYEKTKPSTELAAPKTGMTQKTASVLRTQLPKASRITALGTQFSPTPTPTQSGNPNIPNYNRPIMSINWLDYLRPR